MERTVVFNSTHYGSTLDILNYRLVEHRGDRCIFMLSGYWKSSGNEYVLNLKKNGLFDDVYIYDCSDFYNSSDELPEKLDQKFLKIQSELGVDFSECINYSSSDIDDAFAMYLLSHGYPLNILTNPLVTDALTECRYENLFRQNLVSREFYEMQKSLGALQGERGNCNVIIPPSMKVGTHYDYTGIVDRISDEDCRAIVRSFDHPVPSGDITLVLTNSINFVADLKIETEKIPYMYKCLVDFYVPAGAKYIIKPHPYSPDYQVCFDKNQIMPSNMLVDIFRYMRDVRIAKAISVASTSSSKICDVVDSNLILSGGFFPNYRYMHILSDIIDKIGGKKLCEVYQDFMHDTSFVHELALIRGNDFDFKAMPTPDNDHFMMFSNADYHIGNLNLAQHFSLFYLDEQGAFNERSLPDRKYCVRRTYEYVGEGYCSKIVAYLFTNDSRLKDAFASDESYVLPHSGYGVKVSAKNCRKHLFW